MIAKRQVIAKKLLREGSFTDFLTQKINSYEKGEWFKRNISCVARRESIMKYIGNK
jgi:hypothetical protein